MGAWYDDKAYIYDNLCVDDEELEDLVDIIIKAITQYGIKMICIDNLMTAMDVDTGTDLYREQSKFVGKLAKIAKIYNVVVLLVAHPRKSNGIEADNDDVAGSADITNRVDVVMHYSRDKNEPDEAVRLLKVTKNRLTGKLNRDGIKLIYDAPSKRISDDVLDFKREYGWNKTEQGFEITYKEADIPF